MNDVMTTLDAGCTVFIKVGVGIALLCFSRFFFCMSKACLAYALHQTGTIVLPTTTTASSTALLATPPPPAPKVVAQPAPPEPVEVIECGNCGKEIRSEPVNQVVEPPAEIYKCESCGAQVQVPL